MLTSLLSTLTQMELNKSYLLQPYIAWCLIFGDCRACRVACRGSCRGDCRGAYRGASRGSCRGACRVACCSACRGACCCHCRGACRGAYRGACRGACHGACRCHCRFARRGACRGACRVAHNICALQGSVTVISSTRRMRVSNAIDHYLLYGNTMFIIMVDTQHMYITVHTHSART